MLQQRMTPVLVIGLATKELKKIKDYFMTKLTQDELFGPSGIIPLNHFTGFRNATCSHCGSLLKGVNFPPPTLIILHSCPTCKGLILPFAGRLAAVEKTTMDKGTPAEQCFHVAEALYTIVLPILVNYIRYKVLPEEVGRNFLKDCFDIIYDIVGEKEDKESVLEKLKKIAEETADSRDSDKARAIEAYYEQLSKIIDGGINKVTKIQLAENERHESYKAALKSVGTIDEFMEKFFK